MNSILHANTYTPILWLIISIGLYALAIYSISAEKKEKHPRVYDVAFAHFAFLTAVSFVAFFTCLSTKEVMTYWTPIIGGFTLIFLSISVSFYFKKKNFDKV